MIEHIYIDSIPTQREQREDLYLIYKITMKLSIAEEMRLMKRLYVAVITRLWLLHL